MATEGPSTPSVPCMRVTQLDAHDLDEYLVELLVRQQFDKCIKFIFPNYVGKIKPELQTALYGFLMYCTVGKLHQTVGQKLFGVMLTDSKGLGVAPRKKILCLIGLEIFLYWWKIRYNDVHPAFISSHPKLSKSLDAFISLTKILEIINFLLFLRNGQFNRILLRIMGLRIAFDHPNPSPSSISYTILSRDILWRGFAEASMYFLTLFDIPRAKKYLQRRFQSFNEKDSQTDLRMCKICDEWPTQPYETDCGHIFCYYCASTAISSKSKCPICNSSIESLVGPKIVTKQEQYKILEKS